MENPQEASLEKKTVRSILIAVLLLAFFALWHHFLFGSKIQVLVITVLALVFYASLYLFSVIRNVHAPLVLPVILSSYFFLVALWILAGGVYSSMPFIFQLTILGVIVIAHPKYRLGVMLLFVGTAVVLTFLDRMLQTEAVPPPTAVAFSIVPYVFILTLAGIAFIVYTLKQRFDVERKAIWEQNKMLSEKNRIIHEQNEEINQINQTLDHNVQDRTQQLAAQNQQLIQYAFYNAHKVRGPLCRILGLIYLARQHHVQDMDFILEKIEESARELDSITKAISDILRDQDETP